MTTTDDDTTESESETEIEPSPESTPVYCDRCDCIIRCERTETRALILRCACGETRSLKVARTFPAGWH